MNANEIQSEALSRAVNSPSMSNYPAIFAGFIGKGIPEADIQPRVNIFSFHAWKALGRSVRKGEHGVRIATVRRGEKTVKNADGTEGKVGFSSPWFVTVFHLSQTDPIIGQGKWEPADKPRRAEAKPLGTTGDGHAIYAMPDGTLAAQATYYSEEFTQIK